jgi:hypothetical protein
LLQASLLMFAEFALGHNQSNNASILAARTKSF